MFSIENALKIKRYIQMHLDRIKSDRKDAKRIMEYGMDTHLKPYIMPEEAYFECRSINNAIHDLTKEITKLSNRIHALNTKETNRACRELYNRLVAKGKNKKQAIIAVCNKLLKQVFGCVKNGTMYDDNYGKFLA